MMGEGNEVPILLQFMFGESAALAQQAASERLLRWCQAMDDWLGERQRECHDSTYRGSITAWKLLLSQCAKTPWEIRPADVLAHIDWMQVEGYALSTIIIHLSMLSSFYKWCAKQQVDPVCGEDFNPVAGVPRPKVVHYANAKVLSRAEARALLAILKRDESIIGQRDYAFFLARLMLGVKQITLRQLQWGQIERDEAGVWLRWEADQERRPCPSEVWEALRAYLESSGRIGSIRPEDYIFAPLRDPLKREARGQAGDWNPRRCLSRITIRQNLKLYGRPAGIPEEKLTLPALRHTAVKLRQEAGDNLEQIRTFLGTSAEPKVTKKYLRQLPPMIMGQERPEVKHQPGAEGEQPALPKRKPRSIPGEGITHGFYTQKQPREELEAVLAEDLQGMEEEFSGLRTLAQKLFAAQSEAESSSEVARLGEAYTLAAARLGEISKAERQRAEPSEEGAWVQEVLTMLDNVATSEDLVGDDGELPSEEFWRELAEGDPEMQAASKRLTEEIAALRLVLRRLFDLAMETGETKALVRNADLYGRGCTRLARLLKVDKGAQGRAADKLREMFDQAILEVNEEWGLEI
jgi:site-specific recombinase XerD